MLPTGKDKENPYNIFSRIVTESRKFGLSLIVVSQRPEHFPNEMISQIYTKIVLNLDGKDEDQAIKAFGIKQRSKFDYFRSAEDGLAIIGHTGSPYESVITPWYKPKNKQAIS